MTFAFTKTVFIIQKFWPRTEVARTSILTKHIHARFSAMLIGETPNVHHRIINWQQFNPSLVRFAAPRLQTIQTMREVTSFRFLILI